MQKPVKPLTVKQWIADKKEAKRSKKTITGYQGIMQSYADYCGVSIDEVHNHLTGKNLKGYKLDRETKGMSPAGIRLNLTVIGQFFKRNGAKLTDSEAEIIRGKKVKSNNFKAVSQETLQKMVARGNTHSRAFIATLISTGMRSGELAQLEITDVGRLDPHAHNEFVSDTEGNVIRIRDEIAKNNEGGFAFLTSEARQYLTKWLAEREAYIEEYADRNKALIAKGYSGKRPSKDNRLFACGYHAMMATFTKLYADVDGQQVKKTVIGKDGEEKEYNQNLVTLHSTRRYFRTMGGQPGSIGVDMAEFIMRHRGYLNYRVFPAEQCEQAFRDAERFFTIRSLTNGEAKKALDKIVETVKSRDDEVDALKQQLLEQQKSMAMQEEMMKALADRLGILDDALGGKGLDIINKKSSF